MATIDELNTFDAPTSDDTQQGDGLPRIWWRYGAQPSVPGFFYTKAEYYDGALNYEGSPWIEAEIYDGELGYKAELLRLLPITKRSQPYIENRDTGRRTFLLRWQEGAQILTELLCFAEGVEGPVVFSYHGAAGQAMDGKQGIIPAASRALAAEASKLLKKKVGLSAFWLPIGGRLNAKGKTDFVKFPQGSVINPPDLRLPALEGRDLLNACYAGRTTIEAAAALREQYESWRLERRTNEPDQVEAAPVGDGRNVPQPVGADDYDDVI